MMMVVLRTTPYLLVSWEIMAASSYFLVIFENERQENRRAAFLYLVVAHVGAIRHPSVLRSPGRFATKSESFLVIPRCLCAQPNYHRMGPLPPFFCHSSGSRRLASFHLHVWLPEAPSRCSLPSIGTDGGVMLRLPFTELSEVTST